MKKNTFLVAALLLMVTNMVSQNIVIEREDANGSSISSTEGSNGGVYMADQFVLTGETTLGALEIIGITSGFPSIEEFVLGVNVFIYEDVNDLPAGNPSLPGTGIIELGGINPSNFTIDEPGNDDSDFMINLEGANGGELTLGAGTYWLSVSPVVNLPATGSGSARWNWSISTTNPPNIGPVFIDPMNLFSAGNINWVNAGGLINDIVPAMAWTLYDGVVLSTEDNVIEGLSVSPNPTNGVVNFNLAGGAQLDNISVYDISGRQVISGNNVNMIDLTGYSRGVYVARLTTDNGLTQSARIVKQ